MRSILMLAIAALPFINALTISKTGQCGASAQLTCKGSTFGSCCSQHNYCGTSSAYCSTGCQSGYGTCSTASPPATPAKVSTDGTCGGAKGFKCISSSFGNCCSQFGYCGKTSAYCGSGCNSKFGTCSGSPAASSVRSSTRSSSTSTRASSTSTHSSSVAAPSSILKVSTNARCGKGGFEAFTCTGSKYGDCCSQYSYCGSTDDYCSPQKKCQNGFGRCGPKPSSSSVRSSTSTTPASTSSTSYSSSTSSTVVSSSVPSSPAASSTAPSSSSSSTETPTPTLSPSPTSSAPACVPTQTNAVQNGGFESGNLAPFTVSLTGDWEDERVVGGRPHTGTFYYFGATRSVNPSSLTITQTGVQVLDGTVVDYFAYFNAYRNPGYTSTFQVFIGDVLCGSATVTSTDYLRVGGQVQVSGDVHVVTVVISSTGSDEAASVVGVDDISVVPISGPGADGGCPSIPSTTSTTSSLPVETLSSSVSSSSSSSTETSTPPLTLTPSPTSSAPACVPTQTNAVQNGGFESFSFAPYADYATGIWDDRRIVGGRPHTGTFYYFGATSSPNQATITISQANVKVLEGTVVDCFAYFNTYRNPGYTTTFQVFLDGELCGSATVTSTDYIRVGGQMTVQRDVHVVAVVLSSSGSDEASSLVGVDDISLIPVSGPGADGGCPSVPSTIPTMPSPPGETL